MACIMQRVTICRAVVRTNASSGLASQRRSFVSAKPVPPARDVGILAMETYFPKNYVAQPDLEVFDGVSSGKYTAGLGQDAMAFCDDREDINSMALSAVQRLLDRGDIDPADIGRVEVGTETLIDKSKSTKTILVDLLGNTDTEGLTITNACYGGTAAVFNALEWMTSPFWDGRKALVVTGDIAVYEPGPARPTGGAACVAMLIGPDAPVVFDLARGTHMENAWDFYKGDMTSEYPQVDGQLSNTCYLRALDSAFQRYTQSLLHREATEFSLDLFDHVLFHSPYTKLVQKSFARLAMLDSHRRGDQYSDLVLEETYEDRALMKELCDATKDSYAQKVVPSLKLSRELGNSYTGSIYTSLNTLLASRPSPGQRTLMFSYGSGLAASMFSFRVRKPVDNVTSPIEQLEQRLESRHKCTPEEFTQALSLRHNTHLQAPYKPEGKLELWPGSWVLDQVQDNRVRQYQRA